MRLTELGMEIAVRLGQRKNAPAPMDFTELGIIIDFQITVATAWRCDLSGTIQPSSR